MELWGGGIKIFFLEHLHFWEGVLKFIIELEEDKKHPFLDVLLLKNENSLDFKICRKPTNINRFLSFFSGHARQVKIGLIISLTDCFFRICSPNSSRRNSCCYRRV